MASAGKRPRRAESRMLGMETKSTAIVVGALPLNPPSTSLPLQEVRAAILRYLEHGYPRLEQVARTVGITQRTLQRRLAAAGTSYTQLVNEQRFGLAAKLLEDPTLPIASIAKRAGFANHSGFSRAFHAWTGMTPRQYRAQLLTRRVRGKLVQFPATRSTGSESSEG